MIDLRLALATGALGVLGAVGVAVASPLATHADVTGLRVAASAPRSQAAAPRLPAPAPSPSPSTTSEPTLPSPAPTHPATPVATSRPALRIEDVTAPDALAAIRALTGVRHAVAVRVGRLELGAAADTGTGAAVDGSRALTVAAVSPAELRPLVPQITADADALWDRLDAGELAVGFEPAERLGLTLGQHVPIGGRFAVDVRVGAFASNGTPPIADAVVNRATGARLGLDTVAPTVLVALDDGASAEQVADRLRERFDEVTVIPDPRRPQPVSDAQRRGAATVWDVLALCESSGDWHANTGNGFYGGVQFLPESWRMVGGTGMPHEASREEQIFRAQKLLALQGWKAWPVCSVKLGLRPPPPGWPDNIS